MGNRRRVMKSIKPRIAMVDAHMAVNGCEVFLGHPDPVKAQAMAKEFKRFVTDMVQRAKSPNLTDMYNESFKLQKKILSEMES